jgi:hypothetical protein
MGQVFFWGGDHGVSPMEAQAGACGYPRPGLRRSGCHGVRNRCSRGQLLKRTNSKLSPTYVTTLGALLLSALILACSFYNLRNYPAVWWDEAIFSETAANLVQHGRYAFTVQSPDQLKDFDFRISAGPVVILPVALAYKIMGVGIFPGRLVAGLYLVLAFLALTAGARRLYGPGNAWLAVALAFLGTDVFYWGRSVLGDIPALAMFLWALWFLARGLDPLSLPRLFLGGLFLGLAFDAKEFYGIAFLPPLVLIARQALGRHRRLLPAWSVYGAGLALPLLAYLLLKTVILGSFSAAVLHFLQQKQLLCHEFFTPLTIGRIYPESVLFLVKHPLFWLGLLGACWTWRTRTLTPGRKLWIWNFLMWSLIYLTAVYWQRFALPALFLAAPLSAQFLLRGVALLTRGAASGLRRWLVPAALGLFLVSAYPLWGLNFLGDICTCRSQAPALLADFLRTHVPRWCLIETPEYELAFLDDDHRIHLMPSYYFVESTLERVVLFNPRPQPYNFDQVGADLLILGSFGKSVFRQIYPESSLRRNWRRLAQVGYYDIYVARHSEKKMLRFIGTNFAASQPGKLMVPPSKNVTTTETGSFYH